MNWSEFESHLLSEPAEPVLHRLSEQGNLVAISESRSETQVEEKSSDKTDEDDKESDNGASVQTVGDLSSFTEKAVNELRE